ncbi:MAG: ATP-binding protein [Phycisphaerales bacterium]
MRTSQTKTRGGWVSSWLIGHGGGPQVAVGATMLGLLALTVCAGGAWTFYTQARAQREGEVRAASSSASTLVHAAEALLGQGDAGSLQHIFSDSAIDAGLESATLSLDGVGVVADKNIAVVTVREVPAAWGSGPGVAQTLVQDGLISVTRRVHVEGKGDGTLTVARRFQASPTGDFAAQVGLGGIAAGVGVAGLLAYRSLRSRMRGLGAIRAALHQASAFSSGELPASAMRISDDLGEDALLWNRLITERDNAVARRDIESAAARQHTPGATGGDTATAFDALWMGLIVLDTEARVRAINGAAAVFLKHPRQDIVSRDLGAYVSDPAVMDAVQGVVKGKTKQRVVVETTVVDEAKDLERTILRMTIRPMRKEDGAAALLVVEDITQQRVADESRNAFVAQATHELRTPLTNIRLYLEQLLEEGDADPLVKARCINAISHQARRLERTVGDMLSVSEIEAGTFRLHTDDVRLETLLEELREDFSAAAADKEIDFTVELPPKLPLLTADRDKVAMALHNLVGNAMKYTPTGGKVMVRVSDDGQALRVDVSDNGIGISEEEQELVFEKFYRSKDKRIGVITGSGIGLALARQVVRLHGGDIRVQSVLDKGSTFTLTVPLRQSAAKLAA